MSEHPELPRVAIQRHRGLKVDPSRPSSKVGPPKRWSHVWVVVYKSAQRGPGVIVSWAGDFESDEDAIRIVESNLRMTVQDDALAALWRGSILEQPIAEWMLE